jgi:hypothetical protein
MIVNELTVFASLTVRFHGAVERPVSSETALCATPARPPRPVSLSSVVLLASLYPAAVLLWIGNPINQNEKNKVSSTLLSLRLDAQPTVTY